MSNTAEHHLIVGYFICKYWRRCLRETKTVGNLITTGDLFEEAERHMELVKNWVNDQAIFQPLTDLYIKKSFNVHFEEFTDDCDSIRGCTGKSISYLIR